MRSTTVNHCTPLPNAKNVLTAPVPNTYSPPMPKTCSPPMLKTYLSPMPKTLVTNAKNILTAPMPNTYSPPMPKTYSPPMPKTYTHHQCQKHILITNAKKYTHYQRRRNISISSFRVSTLKSRSSTVDCPMDQLKPVLPANVETSSTNRFCQLLISVICVSRYYNRSKIIMSVLSERILSVQTECVPIFYVA